MSYWDYGFQSPEGDSLFFYVSKSGRGNERVHRFSPPKGIRCFSTCYLHEQQWLRENAFQSPEGDSLFFYVMAKPTGTPEYAQFQSPEGDSLFFYLRVCFKSYMNVNLHN